MARLNTEQYKRWSTAKKSGDTDLMKEIENEGYDGINLGVIDAEIEDDLILPTADDVEASLTSGMTKKDIAEEYGITVQKVTGIQKKGK